MNKKIFSIIILLCSILFSENRKEILDFAIYNKEIKPLLKFCKFNDYVERMNHFLSPQKEITEEYTAYLERICYEGNEELENICKEKNIELAQIIDIEGKLYSFPIMISILSKKGEFELAREYLERFKRIVDIEKKYYEKEKRAHSIFLLLMYEKMMKPMIEDYEKKLKLSELEYKFYNKRNFKEILLECDKINLSKPLEFCVLADILNKNANEKLLRKCKESKGLYYCELLKKNYGLKLNISENDKNCYENSIFLFLKGEKDKKDLLNEIYKDLEELPVFREIILEVLEGI